jgi:hypothetical protein
MAELATPAPLTRSSTQVIQDTLVAAQKQRDKLLYDGVSAPAFFVGVLNVAISSFIVGRWPEHYWVFNTCKMLLIFPARIVRQCAQGTLAQQVEICWLSNALLAAMLLAVFFDEFVAGELLPLAALRRGFLLFFMLAAGPLGWSIVVLGNSLLCARRPILGTHAPHRHRAATNVSITRAPPPRVTTARRVRGGSSPLD